MSIQVSTRVWEGSKHRSGNLLLLLAIADHADFEGKAYPGVKLLAAKTRVTPRHIRRCIKELVESGELRILPEAAPGGAAWYQIQMDALPTVGRSGRNSRWSLASGKKDAHSRPEDAASHPYIREPSIEPAMEPS